MADTPNEAPTDATQAPASVETPTNTEPVQAPGQTQAPDMHGFTSDDLEGMRRFIDNNGGWDAIKKKISSPASTQTPQAPEPPKEPTTQPQPQPQPAYQAPEGSITAQEFLAQQYFQGLSRDPKYEGISSQIASGELLKEMASFNIKPLNQDGSINDAMVRRYLDLKAQTVPAKATGTEPNASTAPTVDYIEVGDAITDIDQAYAVFMQPNHPKHQLAADYIKNHLGTEK